MEPWDSFFRALDEAVNETVRLDCIGGFVVTQYYGSKRETMDVDCLELLPNAAKKIMLSLGGRGGELHKKLGIYMDAVGVAVYPEDYEDRMVEMFEGAYQHLHLLALDPYDIVLSKVDRNSPKDRDDMLYLARKFSLQGSVLIERYEREMKFQVGNEPWRRKTLDYWIEQIEEDRALYG